MTLDFSDGTIFVETTASCAALVTYSNDYAPGLSLQTLDLGGIVITIVKGGGLLPETLTVTDVASGLSYTATVEDFATGAVCVPFTALA